MKTVNKSWSSTRRIDSAEGNVAKFVFETNGDKPAVAEAVLYKYPTYLERTVICCSSQSGCPMGCRFCGAGDYFARSLTADEIVDQVDHCLYETGVNPIDIDRLQVMFMSMGEPALNQRHLCDAIRRLHTDYPNAALLISTSAPKVSFEPIFEASKEVPTVGLQFSVHESTDEARGKLIPFKNKMTLDEIRQTGEAWHAAVGRKPFFNYCAHDGNSSVEDADRLRALLDPTVFEATISVVCERNDGLPARNQHQRDLATIFSSKLLERGYNVRVFDPAGQDDIGGGCGQLWFVQEAFEKRLVPLGKARPSVGHGLPVVHTPGN